MIAPSMFCILTFTSSDVAPMELHEGLGNRGRLSLRVSVVAGAGDVDLCVSEACGLAHALGLGYVEFDANDMAYTCYPDYTAIRRSTTARDGPLERWDGRNRIHTFVKREWTVLPPVESQEEINA